MKFTDYANAATSGDNDTLLISQGGEVKQIKKSVLQEELNAAINDMQHVLNFNNTTEATWAFNKGTPVYTTSGKFGYSMSGGVINSDGIISAPTDTTGRNTVEFWCKVNGTAIAGGIGVLFNIDNAIWIGYDDSTGNIKFSVDSVINTLNTKIYDGNWHHIALVYGRTNGVNKIYGLYVDGISLNISSVSQVTANTWVGNVSLGGFKDSTDYIANANIDELRISKIQRYNGAFTPSAAAFDFDDNTSLLAHLDNNSFEFFSTNSLIGHYPTRPSVTAGNVLYIGPTEPTDWLANDRWVRTI